MREVLQTGIIFKVEILTIKIARWIINLLVEDRGMIFEWSSCHNNNNCQSADSLIAEDVKWVCDYNQGNLGRHI